MQRMEDSFLAQLGITRQQLNAMPPAEREAVLDKVREMMKKEIAAQQQQLQIQQALQTAAIASGGTATTDSAKDKSSSSGGHSNLHTQTAAARKGSAIDIAI